MVDGQLLINKQEMSIMLKKVLGGLVVGVMLASPLHAQRNLMEMMRSDVRAEAQQLMTMAMQLSNNDAEKFWPIYREYELERSRWGDRRIALIKSYAEQYEMMSDDAAKALMDEWFGLQTDRLSLYESYHGRVEQALGASIAARFIQVENQIMMLLDLQIAQEIPLVFKVEGN